MNIEFRNMGTTCSGLLVLPQGALIAHVGDSRVYRLRNGVFEQLTFDHSLQWEMRALAKPGDEATVSGIPKNVITRSLGPKSQVQVDLEGPYPLQPNDRFLLCSDGLTGPVSDELAAGIMSQFESSQAAQLLVDAANLQGGPDNITVLIAEVAGRSLIDAGAGVEPLYVEVERQTRTGIHPGVWITLGVALLLSAGLAIAQRPALALISLFVAIVAGGSVLVQTLAPEVKRRFLGGRRWGKGPYCRHQIPSAERCAALLRQLLPNEAFDNDDELSLPQLAELIHRAASTL